MTMFTPAVIFAVTAAYIVKGMCGFANTLVFSTLAGFSANNVNISPVDLLLGYPSNLYIAYTERKGICPKVCIPLCVLVILGSIPGAVFLKLGDARLIKILFGFVVVFIGLEMFFRERSSKKQKGSPALMIGIGLLSGILCGMFGVGALLVAYVSRTTDSQTQFRANNCVVFVVENTFRLILYSVTGIMNMVIVKNALCLLPFMAAGLGIGIFFQKHIPEKQAKCCVILLLILSGISLILNNLR